MYNIIILNHFYGYPHLEDKCSNKQRYAKLLKLVDIVNQENTFFLENDVKEKDCKLASIKNISRGYGHKWIRYNDQQSIDDIIQRIYNKYKITITPNNSYIILGGTNTAGCLLRTANTSAIQWIEKGFNIQYCLSLCTDYEIDGINTVEKNQMATAIMYSFIKRNKLTDYIDVCYDPRELNIKAK